MLDLVAALLSSKCLVPTFMLGSVHDAMMCGLLKAQIVSLVVGMMLLPSMSNVALGMPSLWLGVSLVGAYWNAQLWRGYQHQRDAYLSRGFSEQHSIL